MGIPTARPRQHCVNACPCLVYSFHVCLELRGDSLPLSQRTQSKNRILSTTVLQPFRSSAKLTHPVVEGSQLTRAPHCQDVKSSFLGRFRCRDKVDAARD